MDDLERYVDILFADYLGQPAAQRLRLEMLNDLLLKKEAFRVSGMNEQQAIQEVLSSLDDFGAPAEGNILLFVNCFRQRALQPALYWLLAGFIMSVPLLTLGKPLFSMLFLLAVSIAAWLYLNRGSGDPQQAAFVDSLRLLRRLRRVWLAALAAALLWLLGAALLSFGHSSFALPVQEGGVYGAALLLSRFYPALLILFAPLAYSAQKRAMIECEVGYGDAEQG